MPTYQVVFTNGEKRDLTVKANSISVKDGMLRFDRAGQANNAAAVVPAERVLYVSCRSKKINPALPATRRRLRPCRFASRCRPCAHAPAP